MRHTDSPAQTPSDGTGGRGSGLTPHGAAQRAALARAAFDLIAARGFEGLRTRDVAARAGVNIATLHYYFATKEDLIRAVVLLLQERFAMGHPLAGELGGEDPLDQLRREFSDAEYQARTTPELFTVLYELLLRGLRDPAIRSILQDVYAHWHEHINAYLTEGVRTGTFRTDLDTSLTAAALITFIIGSMSQALVHGAAYPMHDIHAQVERWLMEHALATTDRHDHPRAQPRAHNVSESVSRSE